jgi:hypothetical protein
MAHLERPQGETSSTTIDGSEDRALGYCIRCLASVQETARECPGCQTPFTGAGRFDRIHGPAPSREFAFLFARDRGPLGDASGRPS